MILVTGGAGYVGSVLVNELLNKGEAVRIVDKLYFGDAHLKNIRNRLEIIQADIRNIDESVLDNINAVIHLAGLSNDPTAEYNPKANYEINTWATEKLAKLCKKKGIKRFIFASTCSIYDKGIYSQDILKDEKSEVSPRAAYAVSNYDAEQILLSLSDDNFCPVILRKGTVYGFSPRMRYDLVVNTFLKDAVTKGILTVFCGGEMWRPLVDVSDAARAFICCVEAPEEKVKGQIFNVVYKNYRVLELAHWVKEAIKNKIKMDIEVDYNYAKARSYRVAGDKIECVLGFKCIVPVKESVLNMYEKIYEYGYTDFLHPKYYNIQWMTLLDEMEKTIKQIGSVF